MQHSLSWVTLLILGISISQIQITEGCMCAFQLVQKHFCESDFFAVVNVKEFNLLDEARANIKVKIDELIKATPEAKKDLEEHELLYTAASGGICGIDVNPGETWIVSGTMDKNGKPTVSSCHFHVPWSLISAKKREALRLLPELECSPQ